MNNRAHGPRTRNYPASQQTGRQAEMWVEHFFTAAGWTVGTYHIDDGYDLFVTPPRSDFAGQSFLVQVKGKARRQKGGVFAPVARARLRDYAANVLPVFIFRVFVEDGTAFWVHAQDALIDNPRLADGSGMAQLRLPQGNEVTDMEAFLSAARPILLPAHRRGNGVAETIAARQRYLSGLDEALDVAIEQHGNKSVVMFSLAEDAESHAQVTAHFNGNDRVAMEDMIHYGQSARVASDSVVFHGSPVFTALGLDQAQAGTLEITSTYRQECRLKLRATESPLGLEDQLVLPCMLARGSKGFTVETMPSAALVAKVRGSSGSNLPMLKMQLEMPASSLYGQDLALNTGIGPIGQWAERALASNRIYGEILLGKRSIGFSTPCDGAEDMLAGFATMGKLHHLARVMNSSYQLPVGFAYSPKEGWLIDAAYRMLKGERVDVEVMSATVESLVEEPGAQPEDYFIITDIPVTAGGELVCSVPLRVELRGYSLEPPDQGSERRKVVRVAESLSTMALGSLDR